jgi:tetratricopeptide (TPR) repeat protein
MLDAINYCKVELEAETIEVINIEDSEGNKIHNSINIIFKNSKLIQLDNEEVEKYQNRVVELILERISQDDLPEQLQVTFYEGLDLVIYHKYKTEGHSFSKDYLQNTYSSIHSPDILFEKKLKELLAENDLEKAKSYCDSIILIDNNREFAFQYRGFINNNLNDTTSSILDFQRALQINPTSQNYLNLAIIFGETNKINKALLYIDTVLSFDSINAKAIYYRGEFKLKKGDTLSACEDMHTSVKLGFKDAGTSLFFNCK